MPGASCSAWRAGVEGASTRPAPGPSCSGDGDRGGRGVDREQQHGVRLTEPRASRAAAASAPCPARAVRRPGDRARGVAAQRDLEPVLGQAPRPARAPTRRPSRVVERRRRGRGRRARRRRRAGRRRRAPAPGPPTSDGCTRAMTNVGEVIGPRTPSPSADAPGSASSCPRRGRRSGRRGRRRAAGAEPPAERPHVVARWPRARRRQRRRSRRTAHGGGRAGRARALARRGGCLRQVGRRCGARRGLRATGAAASARAARPRSISASELLVDARRGARA